MPLGKKETKFSISFSSFCVCTTVCVGMYVCDEEGEWEHEPKLEDGEINEKLMSAI